MSLQPVSQDAQKHLSSDSGVCYAVQNFALRLIIEDDRPKLGTIESTVWVEDVFPEVRYYLRVDGCPRFDYLTSDEICVDDGQAERLELCRYGGFSCRDSTCKTYNCKRGQQLFMAGW